MMQLLLPLGLLALLGVLALIIIYIIKPNYETKHVSSTFVWKMSLKYRKKRLPTSKLRNILLFILQVLILTAIPLIIAQPAIVYRSTEDGSELIAVIDSSMSMYTGTAETGTRFVRAVDAVIADSTRVLNEGGKVSVIIADDSPAFLRQRVSNTGRSDLMEALDALKGGEDGEGESACSYGTSDLDAAMRLSEEVLAQNAYATVKVYTDKSYQYVSDTVTLVPIGTAEEDEEREFNVAILDARAEMDDGYYQLTVELACYGDDREVELNVAVHGANAIDAEQGGVELPTITRSVFCDGDRTKTVIFRYGSGEETQDILYYDLGSDQCFYTFRSIEVYVDEPDHLAIDNNFFIYGGLKEVVKVQYSSGDYSTVGANPFVNGVLPVIVDAFADRWDIKVTEVQQGVEPATEGFDFYIFEHTMPKELPADGAVLLLDPQSNPIGSDISFRGIQSVGNTALALETETHPLLRNIHPENIHISVLNIIDFSGDYEVLLTCRGAPVLIARNDEDIKTAVMAFSVHNSDIVMQPEWFLLMYNLFDYFLPSTVVGDTFGVGESFEVNARGPRVTYASDRLTDSEDDRMIEEFPATLSFSVPGTYTFDVTTYFGKKAQTQYIFVRPPREESNIYVLDETLEDPYAEREEIVRYDDLLLYFAIALVTLLFAEWALHSFNKS